MRAWAPPLMWSWSMASCMRATPLCCVAWRGPSSPRSDPSSHPTPSRYATLQPALSPLHTPAAVVLACICVVLLAPRQGYAKPFQPHANPGPQMQTLAATCKHLSDSANPMHLLQHYALAALAANTRCSAFASAISCRTLLRCSCTCSVPSCVSA